MTAMIEKLEPRIYTYLERVTERGRLAHAYLFIGPAGAGKKEMALISIKRLFCEHPTERPCDTCITCQRITNDNHPDVHRLTPDGQSIKIDQVRSMLSLFTRRSSEAGYRILVVEEADKLTTQAANSMLKFIEEPLPQTIIFFLARSRERILSTIRSRCQELVFSPPSPERLRQILTEQYGEAKAALVSQLTTDLDTAGDLCQREWIAELQRVVLQLVEDHFQTSESLFLIADRWLNIASEREQTALGLDLLLFWYRDLIYVQLGMHDKIVYIEHRERLEREARRLKRTEAARRMELVLKAKRRLEAHVHPQLVLEQLVLHLKEGNHVPSDRRSF